MATYVNDLRLKEIATGDESGTWGTSTNTNLELIAEAFSYGTEAITTNADTHTTTIADGSTDPGRSIYLKYTGTLDSACTITIGPNTVSKLWFIENATSGSQNIIISQGSGANITIPAGDTKVVYSDGAGSGAAFFDAFASINVGALTVDNININGNDISSTNSDGDILFKGSDGGSAITALTLDMSDAGSAIFNHDAVFADNGRVLLGNSSDLQLVHDGSNSYIDDAGTGILYVRGNDKIILGKFTGETMVEANVDGTVELYYDNAIKLNTTATGINVTGTGDAILLLNTASDAGDESIIRFGDNSDADAGYINYDHGTNALSFGANAAERMRIDSSGNVGIGTSSPQGDLTVSNAGAEGIEFFAASGGNINSTQHYNRSGSVYVTNKVIAADHQFFIAGTEKMRINSAGDVVLTGSGNTTLKINTGNNSGDNSRIFFADSVSDTAGFINYDHTNNAMQFASNGAEKMRIDSSGRVGINRTPAISNTKLEIGGADDVQLIALEASGNTGGLGIGATGLQFFTNSTVRGKFDQTGEFLVNRANGFGTGGAAAMFLTGRSDAGMYVTGPNTSGYTLISFQNGGLNQIGSIKNSNNNAVSYNTSSDYRLKENVDYTWDATTRLKQLRPARFNWIADPTDTLIDGFLAHEVSSIVPEAITGTKDATKTDANCVLNSEGNLQQAGVTEAEWTAGKEDGTYDADTTWTASHTQDVYQGIDQAKLVPLLVKTIQELEARITALES